MNWEKELEKLEALLAQGKTDELLEAAEPLMTKTPSSKSAPKERAEVVALIGMARYRRKEFDEARKRFDEALVRDPENERATYGMAYLAAYVDKDPDKVREWMEKLPESAARDNAWIIVIRSPEYLENANPLEIYASLREILHRRVKPDPADPLNTANILHNAGRLTLAMNDMAGKSWDEKSVMALIAVGMLTSAIGLYGTGNTNLHHRAAAYYWASVAQEKALGAAALPVSRYDSGINKLSVTGTTRITKQAT